MKSHQVVEWPPSWRCVPLWSIFERVKDVGHPDEEMLSVYRDYGVISKDSRGDNFNTTAENREIYQLVDDGWLIVNRMKAWQGSVGISPHRGIVSGHYICFRPRHEENPGFLNWLLRSTAYTMKYLQLSRGVRPNQVEIDNDGLRVLPVYLPPRLTQAKIAAFLNQETTRIDALIAKKTRIVSLIRERATAKLNSLLGSAITYSRAGVPIGLGNHTMVRLGALASVRSGLTLDSGRVLGNSTVRRPYLRVANVQNGRLDLQEVKYVEVPSSWSKRFELKTGDVLMTEGGDPDKLGRGTVWRDELKQCLHQNHIFAVRPTSALIPDYLTLVTRTAYARSYFEMTASKTTGIASTSSAKISAFRIPLMPIGQQRDIVKKAFENSFREAKLERCLENQITLLQEHRQALITAAVTGEMEVPGVAR